MFRPWPRLWLGRMGRKIRMSGDGRSGPHGLCRVWVAIFGLQPQTKRNSSNKKWDVGSWNPQYFRRICRRPGYTCCKAQCHFPPLCRLHNTPSSDRPDLSPLAPRLHTPNSHPSDPSRAVRLVDLLGPDLARWLRFRVGPTSPTLYQPCKSLTYTNERCQRKKIYCPTRVWQPWNCLIWWSKGDNDKLLCSGLHKYKVKFGPSNSVLESSKFSSIKFDKVQFNPK